MAFQENFFEKFNTYVANPENKKKLFQILTPEEKSAVENLLKAKKPEPRGPETTIDIPRGDENTPLLNNEHGRAPNPVSLNGDNVQTAEPKKSLAAQLNPFLHGFEFEPNELNQLKTELRTTINSADNEDNAEALEKILADIQSSFREEGHTAKVEHILQELLRSLTIGGPAAAPLNPTTTTTATEPESMPKLAKLAIAVILIGAGIYAGEYGILAWQKAMEAFGAPFIGGLCTAASAISNFAQSYNNFEKLKTDVKDKLSSLLDKITNPTLRNIAWVPVIFALAFMSLSTAMPIGASVLTASTTLNEASGFAKISAALMVSMRSLIVLRGICNLYGSVTSKFSALISAWKEGKYAEALSASIGLAAGIGAGGFYSWNQKDTIPPYFSTLMHEIFQAEVSTDGKAAQAVSWAGFVGAVALNFNYVGDGAQRFTDFIISNVPNRSMRFAVLLIALTTGFPGVALIKADGSPGIVLTDKLDAFLAAALSNYASILDLGPCRDASERVKLRTEFNEAASLFSALQKYAGFTDQPNEKAYFTSLLKATNVLIEKIDALQPTSSISKAIDYVKSGASKTYNHVCTFASHYFEACHGQLDNDDDRASAVVA